MAHRLLTIAAFLVLAAQVAAYDLVRPQSELSLAAGVAEPAAAPETAPITWVYLVVALDEIGANSKPSLSGGFSDTFDTSIDKPATYVVIALGFIDQEIEPDLGLYYMGGRWYIVDLGRFLQVDPLREFWGGYIYVGNNPVFFTDPTGEAETGRQWANRLAADAFRNKNNALGYFYRGLGGFLGTADGISKVANELAVGNGDQLSFWDNGHAGLNLLEVFPALKFGELKYIGLPEKIAAFGKFASQFLRPALNIGKNRNIAIATFRIGDDTGN